MQYIHTLTRPLVVASVIALLGLTVGCSKPTEASTTRTDAASPAQITDLSQSKAASKLGDLSAFRSIAADVAVILDRGDLPTAKTCIKDLEIAWDSAEGGLKSRAADDWHVLDKSIDHALSALRADSPNQADCKVALSVLLKTFDSLQARI